MTFLHSGYYKSEKNYYDCAIFDCASNIVEFKVYTGTEYYTVHMDWSWVNRKNVNKQIIVVKYQARSAFSLIVAIIVVRFVTYAVYYLLIPFLCVMIESCDGTE